MKWQNSLNIAAEFGNVKRLLLCLLSRNRSPENASPKADLIKVGSGSARPQTNISNIPSFVAKS